MSRLRLLRLLLIIALVIDLAAITIMWQANTKETSKSTTATFINKNTTIEVAPYGETIGIYVETKGLLVLGTSVVEGKDGMNYEPAANRIRIGDYIMRWNNVGIKTTKEMQEQVAKCRGKESTIQVRRGKEYLDIRIKPVLSKDSIYRTGIWVREDTQGIGTITYVTKEGKFGALGHGITDMDTGELLDVKKGEIYSAKILNIVKGNRGKPGELEGFINMIGDNRLGKIMNNTNLGIFGSVDSCVTNRLANEFLPVAWKEQIQIGKAYIRSRLGGKKKDYEIEIQKVNLSSTDNKGIVLKVVDPELLDTTGGIVQGMSGSPIIQNGKVIGAVTHVLVDDSTQGYGIFIENMLGASKQSEK